MGSGEEESALTMEVRKRRNRRKNDAAPRRWKRKRESKNQKDELQKFRLSDTRGSDWSEFGRVIDESIDW